ncbi:MAG: hypothetical protein IJE59_01320 [Clostridia bacterium]|nr:hypothetical protein [Clostridia bacterium]
MDSYKKLKKEGIEIIEKLDAMKVNTIAINVASKLCLAFPEHNLNKSDLFESLSRLDMFVAKMPADSSGAKYFYKDNSIYFNETFDINEMSTLAVHECIHCIQELRDSNNNISKMGLYNPLYNTGLSINEAAVQLMASEANSMDITNETYYGISINTISPNYYPLECALLNQIAYFTGTYPLYHSTLNSNDVFKNTFTLKSDKKTYSIILKNFDKLLSLENDVNYYASELQYVDKVSSIKLLNNLINKSKKEITSTFFKTQNLIIEKCFKNEFNSIRNIEDIKAFNKKIYNFKNVIGFSDGYTFYNEFYRKMMNAVEEKREYIQKYGEINLFENINNSLMLVDNTKNAFSFISTFVTKCKKLFGINKSHESINDL